jgi:hypothetical protein
LNPSLIFRKSGVGSRALSVAFNCLRGAFGFEVEDPLSEPHWGPEEGGGSLQKGNVRLQFSYDRVSSELSIFCHGEMNPEELAAIDRTLRAQSFPPA